MTSALCIDYRFDTESGASHHYPVELDPVTLERHTAPRAALPAWTLLAHHQCPRCPLQTAATTHCPMAVALVDLQDFASNLDSFSALHVTVTTPQRETRAAVTAQRGISALMGLMIATCACPDVAWLRPMARFHLPLASEEETIYRAVSMYLLEQYFRQRDGHAPDVTLDGLRQRYQRLHDINLCMAERLKGAASKDAPVNAVVLLDLFAKALPYSVDDSLAELAYLFHVS
jgi:hypothetical protein